MDPVSAAIFAVAAVFIASLVMSAVVSDRQNTRQHELDMAKVQADVRRGRPEL